MDPSFCHQAHLFRSLSQALAAVCPDNACPEKVSEDKARPDTPKLPEQTPSQWAQSTLHFAPSPKQSEVLDSTARYLILCCNRQWGKTTTIAIKALHRALSLPGQSIVIISRTKQQAGILIDRACSFAARLGNKIRRVLGHPFSVQLPNNSRIFAVAHSQDTSVGNTADVLIVDEAALVRDDVYFTVSPFVGRTHGAIWLLSTPRRQAGFFYNIWHDLAPTTATHPWHKIFSTVADCPEIDPNFLAMQRHADETRFRQDFLCEFIQPSNRLFYRELLMKMLDPIKP